MKPLFFAGLSCYSCFTRATGPSQVLLYQSSNIKYLWTKTAAASFELFQAGGSWLTQML